MRSGLAAAELQKLLAPYLPTPGRHARRYSRPVELLTSGRPVLPRRCGGSGCVHPHPEQVAA